MHPTDFPQLEINYLEPCEHRKGYDDSKPENANICMLVTQLVGFNHGVNPQVCAACRMGGSPDPQYIGVMALGSLRAHLQLAYLNFHKKEETVVALFERAAVLANGDKEQVHVISQHLVNCLKAGRLSHAAAEKIAKEHLSA